MKAPLPVNESERLNALRLYRILDTASEKSFDDLTRLAAIICDVPIALISLIDENRQWFKSRIGLNVQETSRDIAFCSHAILRNEVLVVPDACADSRFIDNPLVTGDPHIRFYAGAPLTVSSGHALGTLCVIDRKPRDLTPQEIEALKILREAVVTQLELRRAMEDLRVIGNILPMCAWCHSVRLSDDSWKSPDDYLEASIDITHGICPTCQSRMKSSRSVNAKASQERPELQPR